MKAGSHLLLGDNCHQPRVIRSIRNWGPHIPIYLVSLVSCTESSYVHGAYGEGSNSFLSHLDDYKSELREQLPLIAGSAAAGVVFVVSLVAISIVCSR